MLCTPPLLIGTTECLAVLEAVQAVIGGHPQTSIAATQEPVDARVRWEGFLRQHRGHGHSVKPKQTAARNPDVAVACLSDHVRPVWEAVLDPPDRVRILGNQPVRIERRGSPRQEQQQNSYRSIGLYGGGARNKATENSDGVSCTLEMFGHRGSQRFESGSTVVAARQSRPVRR